MNLPVWRGGSKLHLAVAAAATFACGQPQPGEEESNGGDAPAVAGGDTATTTAGITPAVAIPVQGAPARRTTLTLSVSAAGEASAFRQAILLAQVSGRVATVTVREGDRVSAGRVLVAVDPAEFDLAVREAQARLAAAEAQYRELVLFDDRLADSAIRREREAAARAKSGLDAARVTLERAQLDLRRARIHAPFAGSVAGLKVVPGQVVRAGDELLTVQDLDPIKVEVQVLESEVSLVAPGHRATITFAAFPDRRFTGSIATINPAVEQETRTARVTVTLSNPGRAILPGMYARVALDARRFANRVLVPRSAILERDRRTMLFVFEGQGAEGVAKWRYVTTGLANDSLIEIVEHPDTETVRPGEIVLTDGHYTLIHDARVRLVDDARAAGGRPL